MPGSTPPPLRPVDTDGLGVIGVGTLAFAIVTTLAGLNRDELVATGHGWWFWVGAAGVVLGLIGLGYAWRRRRLRRAGTPLAGR